MRKSLVTRFCGVSSAAAAAVSGAAHGAMEFNLPEPVSPLTREIFDLHMLTAKVGLVIMVIVIGIVVFALFRYRKSRGYVADQNFHRGWFGTWSWVLVPAIVLGIDLNIAGPGTETLKKVEDYSEPDMTVKVTGSQWKWTYEYVDEGVSLVSNLNRELTPDHEHYLRDVDNPLVLPVGKRVRFLHTASDVLHAWWVPALVYKKDSIPGYINETWTVIEKEGVYRGQCAENCGTGHAYMPIVVAAVGEDEFREYISARQEEIRLASIEASADRTWTLDELVERGEEIYNSSCAACHQPNGEGIPNVFPALKGSAMATGPVAEHLNIVLNGKAAWGPQMNDLQIAAVITFERNAWGNDTGDVVQPADVKAAR